MDRFFMGILEARGPVNESTPWWWLSFADPGLPKDAQFLGVAVLQAPTMEAAVPRASLLGINPGGEVQIVGPLPRTLRVLPELANRLLDRAEVAPNVFEGPLYREGPGAFSGRERVTLGAPTPEHNCDEMGCSSVGLHVIAREVISRREGE